MPNTGTAEDMNQEGQEREAELPSREKQIETPEALVEYGSMMKQQIGNRTLEAITRGRNKLTGVDVSMDLAKQVAAVEGEMKTLSTEQTKAVEEISQVRAVEQPPVPETPALAIESPEAQEGYDPAVERLNRDLELGAMLDRLEQGAELTEKERNQVAGVLENRGWHKLFNQVKPGDAVVSFLVPSGDAFSIKNMNDNIFGMQKTDDVIAMRRNILSARMKEAGLEELAQSYKDGYFKISEVDPAKKQEILSRLTETLKTVNEDLATAIDGVVEKELAAAEPDRKKRLEDFRTLLHDPENGYRMSFGLSEVGKAGSDGDFTHVERAIGDSLKGAMLSRGSKEGGTEFTEANAGEIVREVKELRDGIEAKREIEDASGRAFRIFERLADGTKQINLDIIRDVRKGKFKPAGPEDQATLESIKTYMAKLNVLDMLKPYTHEEIAGESIYGTEKNLGAQVAETNALIEKLRTGAPTTEEERARIADSIRQEGKDRTCTSSVEFNKEAVAIKNCTYLSLDVLDVGPKLIQEFDRLLQQVERGDMSFEQASVIAGDKTTREMREFRAKVAAAYGELAGGEKPIMLVGGDEATLAIDSDKIEVTNEFLLKLRRATSSRVVKTVVGGVERHSNLKDQDATKKEHLEAQKLAERGTEIAKEIEKSVRDIRLAINDLPKADQMTFMKQLEDLNIRDFAVKQAEGEPGSFHVIGAKGEAVERRSPADVTKAMNALMSTIGNATSAAFNRLLAEYKDYKKISRRNVARVIRMRNASTEETFKTFLEQMK